jgi:hypothetical protein
VPTGSVTEAKAATKKMLKTATERLRQLEELDATTKIPFVMIELTGEADGEGWVEISGKDEYNVYEQIHEWLTSNWDCEKMDPGDLSDETKIPFCKAQYKWGGYKTEGEEGLSNMGKATMQIIDLMCGQLSWTLAVVTGGNQKKFGEDTGEIRETQIIFKAPHPMNLAVPHMLVEVRSAGYIEVCADLDSDTMIEKAGDPELRRAGFVGSAKTILDSLEAYLQERFKAEPIESMEDYCDRYYRVGEGVFKGTSGSADSNFGLLITDLCDRVVVGFPGWSLVAANGGSYGPTGEHQEQQLIFRRDENPLGDSKYLMAVLNSNGTVEVNGEQVRGVHDKFERFLRTKWGCQRLNMFREGPTISKTFKWEAKEMPVAVTEIMTFFEKLGWEMQVCSQAAVKDEGTECREQQLFFRPGKTDVGTVEPHLFFEFYAGEGKEELYGDEETVQMLANQYIRINSITDDSNREYVTQALEELDTFVLKVLRGKKEEDEIGIKYNVSVFLCRGTSENNVAQWVMRVCDFLVDRLGWSFIVSSQCNMGEYGQLRLNQLVFRYDGDKRDIPVSRNTNANNSAEDCIEMDFPGYWTSEEVQNGSLTQKVVQCTSQERDALQVMLDCTFKRVLTRDRQPDDDAPEDEEMPYCLDLVTAFRSEHAPLYKRFIDRRGGEEAEPPPASVGGALLGMLRSPRTEEAAVDQFEVKTASRKTMVTRRLAQGDAYLFHGTNPSSAMSILKTGFVLDHAGSATGTMYGAGVYMAECASKSDEYGRDDGGNTYPSLNALLVCRCYVGKPHVVDSAGDRCQEASDQGFDSVCGDRETKAGTYREFVFFDEAQVYPEYVVIYRRQYESSKAPRALQGLTATGTTGRFWQMKLEKGRGQGWRNVPAEINKQLIKADKSNTSEVACDYQGTPYLFNLAETKATNQETGQIFPLRRPMAG